MGNAESGCGGGSGDEEDMETESPGFAEDNLASAAIGGAVGGSGGTGSGRSGRGSNNPPAATEGPPSPEFLLEQVKLREAAARISDSGVTIHESVLSGNEGVLIRWLEDRLNRGEESVNVEQFCEMLESRDAPRNECEEVYTFLKAKKTTQQQQQKDNIAVICDMTCISGVLTLFDPGMRGELLTAAPRPSIVTNQLL